MDPDIALIKIVLCDCMYWSVLSGLVTHSGGALGMSGAWLGFKGICGSVGGV